MRACEFALIGATEGRLHGVDTRYSHLSPHGDSGGAFLALLHSKLTTFEAKERTQFMHYIGEHTGLLRLLLVTASVHKHVLIPTVPVQIAKQHQLSLSMDTPQ